MSARFASLRIALVCTAGFTASLPAVEPLTMGEAVTRALAGNRELATAALTLQASDLTVADALNAFAVTVRPEVQASATQDGATTRLGLSASRHTAWGTDLETGVAVDDLGDEVINRHTGTMHMELRQPLLRGRGKEIQLDAVLGARAGRLTSLRSFEGRRAALVLDVVQTHQELARLQSQLTYDELSVKRYAQLQKLTQAREKQGRASRVDSLRVDFQYGQAGAALSATRERLAALRGDLAELLGAPPDAPLEAIAGPALELDGVSAETAVGLAFSNRLDYAESLQAVGEARRGTKVARHRILPTADLVARYSRRSDGPSFDDGAQLDEEIWAVGLAGDTDLHRRSERSALRRSLLDAAAAEEGLATLENRIRREVQQSVLAYQRALEQAGFADRNLVLARDRAKLARRLFELGRGDNFTATDAETELLRAQSQQLEADAEATVAAFRLKSITGTLVESPDDLKPRPIGHVLGQAGK